MEKDGEKGKLTLRFSSASISFIRKTLSAGGTLNGFSDRDGERERERWREREVEEGEGREREEEKCEMKQNIKTEKAHKPPQPIPRSSLSLSLSLPLPSVSLSLILPLSPIHPTSLSPLLTSHSLTLRHGRFLYVVSGVKLVPCWKMEGHEGKRR